MQKHRLVFITVALLSVAGMAWAGGAQEVAQKGLTDEPVTLTYMTRMRAEEFGRESFNGLAAGFAKEHPNVKIEFVDITYQRMREQTLIMAQAGTAMLAQANQIPATVLALIR